MSVTPTFPELHGNGIIGIRREDKNEWEHRVALVPNDVRRLVREGVTVLIQPSGLRAYSDQEYVRCGARVAEDLSEAGTIIGVKEVPPHKLVPGKTWCFFTHTIKGQEYAMPLLDRILATGIRCVDYERIANDAGNRLVFFGLYAGYAGMIDTLTALGLTLIKRGFNTPFLNVVWSKHYSDLTTAKNDCYLAGARIKQQGLPASLGPCVVVVTGSGNSAQGAIEILETLPIERVTPAELPGLRDNYKDNVVYLCQVTTADFIRPVDKTKTFDKAAYYADPSGFECVFEEEVLPYATVIVNCIFWDRRYPRLVTVDGIKRAAAQAAARTGNPLPLAAVGDVSCDIGGSIEFVTEATTIENPTFYYEPATGVSTPSHAVPSGIAVCSIDHLPAELPRSASEFFSRQLCQYIKPLAFSKADVAPEDQASTLPPEIARAVIAQHGALTDKFTYIDDIRTKRGDVRGRGPRDEHVVIFGSGRMVAPALEYLMRTGGEGTRVTVASMLLHEAQALVINYPERAVAVKVSVTDDTAAVDGLIASASVVVSLLPAPLHIHVAKPCVRNGVHLVTASYVSDEIRELDARAREAGVTILGEMGLDPGIDHMSAVKMIHEARALGGRVDLFASWCGGLPAPEHAKNPLRYKFSWAPRSAVMAGKNPAVYLWDGEERRVEGKDLFRSARPVDMCPGLNFEGYANRDSLSYVDAYGLQGISTMFRGTLRFKGYSVLMYGLTRAGLLDADAAYPSDLPAGASWLAATARVLGCAADASDADVEAAIRAKLADAEIPGCADATVAGCRWLGLLDAGAAAPRPAPEGTCRSALDATCSLMEQKMAYGDGETDLVFMHHDLEVVFDAEGGRREHWSATMSQTGQRNGPTAMATTVGLPVGIAVRLLLEGKIESRGVIRPIIPEIFEPALELLGHEGIHFFETRAPFVARNADFASEIPSENK